jgi:transcriptional regulator with XRE-family HTH domain
MAITTAQIRGARGILNWSQHDLSERTGISATSIGSIENGQSIPRENTLHSIKKAFEDSGIEFLPNQGIKMRSGDVNVLRGADGFKQFMDDVYNTLKTASPANAFVSNVNEKDFVHWLGNNLEDHLVRMNELKNVKYNILIREGDQNFTASKYAEYRWMPKDQFTSVPFYVYGNKLAILLFEAEPTVIILNYISVADAYKIQFQSLWQTAKVIK